MQNKSLVYQWRREDQKTHGLHDFDLNVFAWFDLGAVRRRTNLDDLCERRNNEQREDSDKGGILHVRGVGGWYERAIVSPEVLIP